MVDTVPRSLTVQRDYTVTKRGLVPAVKKRSAPHGRRLFGSRLSSSRTEAFALAVSDQEATEPLQELFIPGHCSGCGVKLQDEDTDAPGYA